MRLTTIFLLVSLLAFTYYQRGSKKANIPDDLVMTSLQASIQKDTIGSTIDFKTDIQPIFKTRCSPCHFPGGKMYAKLPFDSAQTIINHQEGILRRIKDPEEVRMIKTFIETSNKQ